MDFVKQKEAIKNLCDVLMLIQTNLKLILNFTLRRVTKASYKKK